MVSPRSLISGLGGVVAFAVALAACNDDEAMLGDHPCYSPDRFTNYPPRPTTPQRIPIALHHVLREDGSSRSSRSAIDDRLFALKESFLQLGVEVYLAREDEVSSDGVDFLRGAINIYVAPDGKSNALTHGTHISIPQRWNPVDWVHALANHMQLTFARDQEGIDRGRYDLEHLFTSEEQQVFQCLLNEEGFELDSTLSEAPRDRIDSLTVRCEEDPQTFQSIQDAADQISSGGSVMVCRGRYEESLQFLGGTFEIFGRVPRPGVIDPVFLGVSDRRTVEIDAGADITLRNIGFTEGVAEEGGFVRVNDSQLRMSDNLMGGGEAVRGGALACFNSHCEIRRIDQSMSLFDGVATEAGGAVYLDHSDLMMEGVLINGNLVEGGRGAGISAHNGSILEATDTHFFDMRSGRGAALYLEDSEAHLRGGSSISATLATDAASGAVELVAVAGESTFEVQAPISWDRFGSSSGMPVRNNPADVVIRGGSTYARLPNDESLFCSTGSGICE